MAGLALRGERVLLRPFCEDDLDAWLSGRRRLDQRTQPEGPPEKARLRRLMKRSGRFSRGRIQLQLAIEADGDLIGEVQVYRPPGRPLPPKVFEFGIALFDERQRRQGYGSEAIRLLTAWLFQEAAAKRVQTGTPLTNQPMHNALEKLGFKRHGHVEVGGVDHALYAIESPVPN